MISLLACMLQMSRSGPLLSKDMPTGPEGRNSEVSESRRVRINTQNNELTWEVERQELSLRLQQVTCSLSLSLVFSLSLSLSRARALSARKRGCEREQLRERDA
jgi:hypothetical protein